MRNFGHPTQQETEVVTGGGQDGIEAIAFGTFEVIAAHVVLSLEIADNTLLKSQFHISPACCSRNFRHPGESPDHAADACTWRRT